MKAADYIIEYLKKFNIRHYFGYQGTMIAHFVDSIGKDPDVENHVCYNEQGAALAAVGYAKLTGELAVAYATSGPGALNLLNGVADAYYDSAPVLFFTGQLNTYEYTDVPELRQQGFQEADVVDIAKPITKYAVKVEKEEDLPEILEKAVKSIFTGRKGPALIDIPMNIQRGRIDVPILDAELYYDTTGNEDEAAAEICEAVKKAKAPMLLLGNGLTKDPSERQNIVEMIEKTGIPVMTTMLGRDILPANHPLNYGYIGSAYGHRYTNLLSDKKADLIVALGASMCRRQTGNPSKFAVNAKIIRVDIDPVETSRKVHDDELSFTADANSVLRIISEMSMDVSEKWLDVCSYTRKKLQDFEVTAPGREPNRFLKALGEESKEDAVFCCDVGQHQVWSAQSIGIHGSQRMLFSGGHGAMGFALPAAIGASYASKGRVYAVAGDGAFQMNIQELQWLVRENLDITAVVMNNRSLGLIQQQQDDFFDKYHIGATADGGFTSPSFSEIAKAYGIKTASADSVESFKNAMDDQPDKGPYLIEVSMEDGTKAYPKTYFGEEMYNQKPYVQKELMDELLALEI